MQDYYIMTSISNKPKGQLSHDTVNTKSDAVAIALAHLHNLVDEKAERSAGVDSYKAGGPSAMPVSQITLMKSMFGSKPHRFRLTRTASLVTSGGGQMNLGTSIVPSQFSQYTALQTLFSECRLVSTSIQYASCFGIGSTTTVLHSPMMSAFWPDAASTSPTVLSYDQCARLTNSMSFSSGFTTARVRNSYKAPLRIWSYVAATATGQDPIGGVLGAWSINNLVTLSNSTTYFGYLIEAVYDFRNLAPGV
jgi:hypothetical protein